MSGGTAPSPSSSSSSPTWLASPDSLQSLCMTSLCDNLLDICACVTSLSTDTPYPDVYPPCFTVLRFPFSEVFFHTSLAEALLERLGCEKRLTDQVMTLFEARSTHLRSARIRNATQLTSAGLRTLRGHKLVELDVQGLSRATVTDLVGCLGDWSIKNMRSLSVSGCTFVDSSKMTVTVSLSKLRNLQSLNVSSTEFNKNALEMVMQDLPLLEHLNISSTRVTDVGSLLRCKQRLKTLSMFGLRLESGDALEDVLSQLTNLRHLDLSEESPSGGADSNQDDLLGMMVSPDPMSKFKVNKFLKRPGILPNLSHLDISGRDGTNAEALEAFMSGHTDLMFLGLCQTEVCKDESVLQAASVHPAGPIAITGSGSESQVVEALKRYSGRQHYIQNSLYHLFKFTQGLDKPRPDLIYLVISAANQYRTVFAVQMAATACLYNLSKTEVGAKLHTKILKDIVEVDLNAMEEFPQHQQLQKNVLLTICSDRILQEVNFNRFRCAKLVMDSLYTWQNPSMNRMSVAICSILAAKITTQETSQLGSSSNYMKKLLKLVQRRTVERTIDVTLKFTLSALWNLTDESPTTCQVFLQEGGLDLYLEVLNVFPGDDSVETKVLGLLNNIAEVNGLRNRLMINEFISTLAKLMHSSHIDVSYFAAGIVAHLASCDDEDEDDWPTDCMTRPSLMEDLTSVVTQWESPKDEMVAYRSFRPFLPLLKVGRHFAVQLWAIWAIHQVCSKNPKRYCPMLREDGCDTVLRIACEERPPSEKEWTRVAGLAKKVLDIMDKNGYLSREECKSYKNIDMVETEEIL